MKKRKVKVVCSICWEKPRHKKDSYCKECRSEVNKSNRDSKKQNSVYVWVPTREDYTVQRLYIGITNNINRRVCDHMTRRSDSSKKIYKLKINFNIFYTDIDNKFSKHDLECIELLGYNIFYINIICYGSGVFKYLFSNA